MNQEHRIHAKIIDDSSSIHAKIIDDSSSIHANIKERDSTPGPATTEKEGVIRIATEEEALEGINKSAAITPYTLHVKTQTCFYVHEQAVASDNWVIEHNLNKPCPNVILVDSAGTVFYPATKYIDNNKCIVPLIGAMTGKAYVS